MADREARPGLTDEETLAARDEKRAVLAADRKAKRTPKRGLVIVYTGNGKGKTTAALGVLLRAWGRGMRVVMFQFIKARTGKWGEVQAAQRIGVTIVPLGDGFTWESDNIEKDRALAAAGWAQCAEHLRDPACDVVILDELTYPLVGRDGAGCPESAPAEAARHHHGAGRAGRADRPRRSRDGDARSEAPVPPARHDRAEGD